MLAATGSAADPEEAAERAATAWSVLMQRGKQQRHIRLWMLLLQLLRQEGCLTTASPEGTEAVAPASAGMRTGAVALPSPRARGLDPAIRPSTLAVKATYLVGAATAADLGTVAKGSEDMQGETLQAALC